MISAASMGTSIAKTSMFEATKTAGLYSTSTAPFPVDKSAKTRSMLLRRIDPRIGLVSPVSLNSCPSPDFPAAGLALVAKLF